MIRLSAADTVNSFMNATNIDDIKNSVSDDVEVEEWMSGKGRIIGLNRLVSDILEPAQHAFSNTDYEIVSVIACDDLVAVHARFQGVFTGEYMGYAPTMEPVSWSFHDKFRVADGKIVEMWFCSDTHAIMTQIAHR